MVCFEQAKVSSCEKCLVLFDENIKCNSDSLKFDNTDKAMERIRELELELAQTKLAQVEAECKNQVRYLYCFEIFSHIVLL